MIKLHKLSFYVFLISLFLFSSSKAMLAQGDASIGIGYSYMNEYDKGGFYANSIGSLDETWGILFNLEFYTVENYEFSFFDINATFNLIGSEDFQILPYAGLAFGTLSDGEYDDYYDYTLDIDGFDIGISYGIAGVLIIKNLALSCNYGINSTIKQGMFRIAVGYIFD